MRSKVQRNPTSTSIIPQAQLQNQEKHPGAILNQLSLNEKIAFQSKFNQLSPQQQQFVYEKLLSSPSHVQVNFHQLIFHQLKLFFLGFCHISDSSIKWAKFTIINSGGNA